MFLAATLSLLAAAAPQGTAPASPDPLLSTREQESIAKRLQDYLAADAEYRDAEGVKDREKTGKARRSAKEKFEKEWDKAEKKGNLLGSVIDLRAIFHNCFERGRPGHVGRMRLDSEGAFGLYVPKTYKPKQTYTTIVALPGGTGASWQKPEDYYAATWDGCEPAREYLVHVPVLPDGLEFDPIPDYTRKGAVAEEDRRHGTVLGTFGQVMKNYTVERAKVFLDCGRGTCGYGLRLATLFPDRFAGVILRDPVAVDDIRLGTLCNLDILMLKTDDNAAVVDALTKRFEEACPGKATVLSALGAYPHKESSMDIVNWLSDKQRDFSPAHVVIENNDDRFKKAYWANIAVADSLLTTAADEKPRMEVKADRENNRITVDCRGVERFQLLLNDELVDLDKEFTIVINGKAITEKRSRSFRKMLDQMLVRGDWEYLFPVSYDTTVPE